MNKSEDRIQACIHKLYDFRAKIPANLTAEKVAKVWKVKANLDEKTKVNQDLIERKTKITKENLDLLVVKPFVKFIGISGSVASEFPQEDDDIDIFIVVKNNTAWIYRAILYLKNLKEKKIRSKEESDKGASVKDKFCINLISEERALHFSDDVFNLNELLYIKPIYNQEFLKLIYLNNDWLYEKYFVSKGYLGIKDIKVGQVKELTKRSYLLAPFNFLLFVFQFLFMILMRHKPNMGRLWKGFKKGRIEFYPEDFKDDKIV